MIYATAGRYTILLEESKRGKASSIAKRKQKIKKKPSGFLVKSERPEDKARIALSG